jgi:DNA polymerase III subunit delta
MTAKTREELWRDLKRTAPEPLYLLYGAEDFLRDRAARAITEAALADSSLREFNETEFSLANSDVQHAIAAAEQLPMMSARRVVRVRDFNRLPEEDEETLTRYLTKPAASTVMIFLADDLDKRRKLSKMLLNVCVAVEFTPLKDAELLSWARTALKEMKASADDGALNHLIATKGASVREIATELEKLSVAALPEGRITFDMVDSLAVGSRELSNFALSDALIAHNRRRALSTLQRLLDDGAEPLMLIGLIASHYHRLSLAKELMSQGAPEREVFRLVPMPFGKREEFLATARRASAESLTCAIRLTAAADLAIKTSQATPRLQLEMLVCELTNEARGNPNAF